MEEHESTGSEEGSLQLDEHIPQTHKLAFTESLTSEPPRCPECQTKLVERNLEKCTYCGFHYGYLEKLFPRELPVLKRINDFSNQLSDSELKSLEKTLRKIKRKYPQIFIKLAILPLQPDVQIQQMGLWMHNECPLPSGETEKDRLWTILLLIDTTSRSICYANGYKVELFWTTDNSTASLKNLNHALRNHPLYEALEDTLQNILINLDHSKKLLRGLYRQFKKRA